MPLRVLTCSYMIFMLLVSDGWRVGGQYMGGDPSAVRSEISKSIQKKLPLAFPREDGKVGPSVQRRERARAGMTRHSRLRERLDGVLVEVGHGDTRGELRIEGAHGQRWGRNTGGVSHGFFGLIAL